MGTLQNYVDDVQELIHDTTSVSWPLSRVISRINDARQDVARDMHCVRSVVTGIQLLPAQGQLPAQEIYNLNGAVAGANVTSGGSGFGGGTTVPITFDAAPAGGVTALGIGNLVSGALSTITMTQWGSGYLSRPNITIGGAGVGAAATAVTLFNTLSVLDISVIWTATNRYSLGYRTFDMFQRYFRIFGSTFSSNPLVFSHHKQGLQVYIQPPPSQVYLTDWDVIRLPQNLVALTDVDSEVIFPWSNAVQFKAAEYLHMKHLTGGIPLSNSFARKYDEKVPRIITTSGGIIVPNPYSRTMQRRAIGSV